MSGRTAANRLMVTSSPVNLLTADQSTSEAALGAWQTVSNCAIIRSTAEARQGIASIRSVLLNDAAGSNIDIRSTPPVAGAWTPGQRVTGMCSGKYPAWGPTPFPLNMYVFIYDAGGVLLGTSGLIDHFETIDNGNGWYDHAGSCIPAPLPGAAKLSFIAEPETLAVGDFIYMDRIGLFVGSWHSSDWVAGS